MLKLKLQYFGHKMQRADSLEKTLKLEKIEGKRKRGCQKMRWLDSITDSTDMNLSKFWEIVEERKACCAAVYGTLKSFLQHHSSKASNLHSAFFMVQLSHPYMTTGKTIVLTIQTLAGM